MTTIAPTSSPSAPMAFVANVVQLVNEGDTVFSMKYGPRDRLVLQPGESYFVQEEVAWQFLGRWWTDNADPRNRARVAEVNRLHVLYGAYEDEILWEQTKPRLVAYAATGERITTVVDDPEGNSGTKGQTAFGREQSLEAQMQIMQQQMLALQAQLEARDKRANDTQPDVADDIPAPATSSTPSSPGPKLANVGGQVLPVAPPSIPAPSTPSAPRVMAPSSPGVTYDAQGRARGGERPVPQVQGDAIVGVDLPVHESVVYVPPAAAPEDVPVDTPARVPTGSRIPAGRPADE